MKNSGHRKMAKAKTAPTCRALPDIAGQLVSAEGMPSASNINGLDCQTSLKARFDTQRVFPALSNHIIERDDGRYQIGAVRMTARLQAISVAIPATTTTCVYRKLKLGHSDGETRRGSGVNE
jgi:hypothetical protein